MTEDQKKPFVDESKKDQIRRQNQMNELMTKGYFMTVDGKKSTDLKKKVKRVSTKASSEDKSVLKKRKRPEEVKESKTQRKSNGSQQKKAKI